MTLLEYICNIGRIINLIRSTLYNNILAKFERSQKCLRQSVTNKPQLHKYLDMNQINKTNAARLLDAGGIAYSLIPYNLSEEDLSAQHVPAQLNEEIETVFKTLVLRRDRNGLFVCVIPGNFEVYLKISAKISGNKSCDMIRVKELQPLTVYIRGGCSPIGMKKKYPTFIHESAPLYDHIYISAGVRGVQIKINPNDLIKFTEAEIYPL